jgi:hypothetical protein
MKGGATAVFQPMVSYRGPYFANKGPITVCLGQVEIQCGLLHLENGEHMERISGRMNAFLDAVEEAWKKKNSQ